MEQIAKIFPTDIPKNDRFVSDKNNIPRLIDIHVNSCIFKEFIFLSDSILTDLSKKYATPDEINASNKTIEKSLTHIFSEKFIATPVIKDEKNTIIGTYKK